MGCGIRSELLLRWLQEKSTARGGLGLARRRVARWPHGRRRKMRDIDEL